MNINFSNSFTNPNFTDLLNSQQETFSQPEIFSQPETFSQPESPSTDQREPRQRLTAIEEKVLVNSWLNTSKDPIVGNEQRRRTFWQRVAAYYAGTPAVANRIKREANVCKQKWGKLSESVSKFAGCYEFVKRNKKSGQNEEDFVEVAYQLYLSDNKVKFTLEHAWRLLRQDQKWCTFITEKTKPSSKHSRLNEATLNSSTSNTAFHVEEEPEERPLGVKASKVKEKKRGKGKSEETEENSLKVLKEMWVIKDKDNLVKERLSKQKILECLILKSEPLSQGEETLKNKLIAEMCAREDQSQESF